MDATITGLNTEQAYFVADTANANDCSRPARVTGVGEDEVTISREGLDNLAELDEDHDGHFDGQHVWIGGTEYQVRGI